MSSEEHEYIKKIAQELATASHQSRDREVSGLFRDINNRIDILINHISGVQSDLEDLRSELKTFKKAYNELDKKTVKYDLGMTMLFSFFGVAGLALVGAILNLVII